MFISYHISIMLLGSYHKCPRCRISQYKVKGKGDDEDNNMKKDPPRKVLWYLPIITQFKCLFVNVNDAKNLT